MKRKITDFSELPNIGDLFYASISTYGCADMQNMVCKVAHGAKIGDIAEDLNTYTKIQFRLGKLNNGNFAVISAINGDDVDVINELSQEQYNQLVNQVASEVIVNSLAEIQFAC